MKVVAVKFKNARSYNNKIYDSKDYHYRTNFLVSVGDEVVVDTANNGLQVALVVNECVTDPKILKDMSKYKFIVQVVDKTEYMKEVEKDEKMKELKFKLDALVEADNRMRLYETLAEDNPEIADILSEYKSMM